MSYSSSGALVTWVPILRRLIARACSADGVTPSVPIRFTAPETKSEPELSSVCSSTS